MTTATAQAAPKIAFIKCTLAKLGRTNRKIRFRGKFVTSGLLAKFCNKFETCQSLLRCDFKRGFKSTSGYMIFNSLQYLSNSPLDNVFLRQPT